MSNGVQFDFDNEPRATVPKKSSGFAQLVIKMSFGLVKDEDQANYVLLGVATVAFGLSIFLFSSTIGNTPSSKGTMVTPAAL